MYYRLAFTLALIGPSLYSVAPAFGDNSTYLSQRPANFSKD